MKHGKKRTELSCATALWISMAREVNNRSITKINLLVYCNYVRMFLFVGDWWLHEQKTTMKNKSRGRMNRQVWKCIAHVWDAVIEATTICEMNQFGWHTGRQSKIITLYTVWKTKELMMVKFNIKQQHNRCIGQWNHAHSHNPTKHAYQMCCAIHFLKTVHHRSQKQGAGSGVAIRRN